jgi:hypothetical protein
MAENEIIVSDENSLEGRLTGKRTSFCSIVASTQEEKIKLFNLQNNPDKRLKDQINKQIVVKDVFAEEVTIIDKNDGLEKTLVRVVIIDDKGISYQCVSVGIFSALQKMFSVFGMPNTWAKPITVEVLQISKGERNMLTLSVVPTK